MGKLWEAAGCAASYLLLDPDDDTMIDNLRYFKQELGDQSLHITARKVRKWLIVLELADRYTGKQADTSVYLWPDCHAV